MGARRHNRVCAVSQWTQTDFSQWRCRHLPYASGAGRALSRRPHFLAGTRQLLYRVSSRNGRNNSYYVTSLDTSERKLIATLDAGNVTYSQGRLLFMQNHTLMAQPFDLKNLVITGPPKPIASNVLLSTGSPPVFGVFSASQTGRLVFLSEGSTYNNSMTVLELDR